MPELVKINPDKPNSVDVWGFHDPCSVRDVAAALTTISSKLKGDGWTINIMSGTHGYCKGMVGAVATREQKFADEDRSLANPKTSDNKSVALKVFDFNTGNPKFKSDPVTEAMSQLNSTMQDVVAKTGPKNVFLLAYCCSAGTR